MSVYVHLATGFEEVEALAVVDVLRRAGVDVRLVSVTGETQVTGAHDITVEADLLFAEADYDTCEMIVLPGGMPGTTNLGAHAGLTARIREFALSGKWLAAICAAPLVLAAQGVLSGKEAVIYPGMEAELGDAVRGTARVVQDGKIITSKGPGTALEFGLKLAAVLKGEAMATQLKDAMVVSS